MPFLRRSKPYGRMTTFKSINGESFSHFRASQCLFEICGASVLLILRNIFLKEDIQNTMSTRTPVTPEHEEIILLILIGLEQSVREKLLKFSHVAD